MSEGFIALHREAFNHPLLKDGDRFRAWFWLVANAAWRPTRHDARGKTIQIERGQICAGREWLAKEWKWSPSAVERFLARLETEQMIERQTGLGKTIITICNYDKYQDQPDASGQLSGQKTGQKSDRNRTAKEQRKQGKQYPSDTAYPQDEGREAVLGENPIEAPAKPDGFPCPDGVDPMDWDGLKANRKAKRAALSQGAHRQIIAKLDGWRRSGWPPGPIVAFAAERGWTTVFETDEMKDRRNDRSPATSLRPAQPRTVDGAIAACDRLIAESRQWASADAG